MKEPHTCFDSLFGFSKFFGVFFQNSTHSIFRAKKPFHLLLDTINVSLSDLEVKITDEKGKPLSCKMDDSALNKTTVTFTPPSAGKLKVECNVRGKPVDGSPLSVTV